MAPKRKRTASVPQPTVTIEDSMALDDHRPDASQDDDRDSTTRDDDTATHQCDGPAAKRSRSSQIDGEGENGQMSLEEQERIDDALEHGEGGERGHMKMQDPPKAGLVDPVGYKTNAPPEGRAVRIYADGVFDLFHLGHMRQLQQAKQAFPDVYLIVGVTGDKETHRRKGLTVLSAKERAESVRHCKWVDEVVEDCPWIISDAPGFMEKYEIDYVAHDDIPYGADEGDDIYAPIKKAGKFLVTQRTEGVSTTGIITKIVRDYDKYIARQLHRGTPRQELNVSWIKKNEMDFKRTMSEIRESIRTNWTTTGQELGRELRQFWQSSRPSSPAPPSGKRSGRTSPTAVSHLSHLDIPKSSPAHGNGSADFAAGYSLGLIGGVRSWMDRSRRNLNDPSRGDSDSTDEGELNSPEEAPRGRTGQASSSSSSTKIPPSKNVQAEVDAQVQHEQSKA